jgi:hypothetical protein
MFRGEFHRADGLVIPNNVTIFGAQAILEGFARNVVPVFYAGLCNAVYEPDLTLADIEEPTIGTNGYARIPIARDNTGWPIVGDVNNEPYIESLALVWAAVVGPFDKAVTRMFLTPEVSATVGNLYCLSGAMPEEFTVDTDTVESDRTFKYRLFAR